MVEDDHKGEENQVELTDAQMEQTNIVIANGNFAAVSAGDVFTVHVDVQASGNRIGPQIVPGLGVVEATATAIKQ